MEIGEKFLPIGTVVMLKEGTKRVMIVGFCPITEEEKTYDYNGCLYPEGVLSSKQSLLFNHDQIKEVYFKGFVDDEQKEFIDKVKKFIAEGGLEKKEAPAKPKATPIVKPLGAEDKPAVPAAKPAQPAGAQPAVPVVKPVGASVAEKTSVAKDEPTKTAPVVDIKPVEGPKPVQPAGTPAPVEGPKPSQQPQGIPAIKPVTPVKIDE